MEGGLSGCAMERDTVIVAGFGFRAAATVESLLSAYKMVVSSTRTPVCLAAPADKCRTDAFQCLAARLNMPIRAIAPADLERLVTQTQSAASRTARGTGSVCEAAALAAAGPDAQIKAARAISEDRLATCSIAEGKGK